MLCLAVSGLALWVGGLAVLHQYFELAAIATLVLTLVFFGIAYYRKEKTTPACDIECKSKPYKDSSNRKKVTI